MSDDAVSQFAEFCAHCGWIEPINLVEVVSDTSCATGCVFVHKEDCRALENGCEHELFIALWNARDHIIINEFMGGSIHEHIENAMSVYIKNQLTENSAFLKLNK